MPSFARFAIGCALACAAIAAGAQTYPARPLRIVLGFPPAGGVDLVARILTPKLTESLGQQVIVDNRPGASGLIGTEIAARAAPDGHTLFLGTTGNLSVNPTLYPNFKLDIARAFAPVMQVSSVPFLLYLHPALPPKTVAEFVAFAKARPGKIHWYGMVAPAGTPRQIIGRLNAEVIKAMSLPEIAEKLIAQGTEPAGSSPEAFEVEMTLRQPRIPQD